MVFNKRNAAAFLLSRFLIISGKTAAVKKRAANREIILSVYFHDPSRELFEFCIKWFLKKGYSFITPDQLSSIAAGKEPFPSSAVLLTVDDGWKNNKNNIAAVAKLYNIPVTIFASTQPIATGEAYWWSYIAAANKIGLVKESVSALKHISNEERMDILNSVKGQLTMDREALTIEEVQEIEANTPVTIGSHTVTHPILTKCSDEQSEFEISESRKILQQWLQKEVNHFAYPNGEYTEREIKFLKESGYKTAFTTKPQYITADNFANMFTLPRFDVLEDVSFAENICRMTGAWFKKPSFNGKG